MIEAPLNLFQCAMLRWRELHPYCAAHVVAVPRALDLERLRATIAGVLEDGGLTGFTLDARRRRIAFAGGPAAPVLKALEGGGPPLDLAAAEIASSINVPFPPEGAFDPFRFFAVRDGDACLVGIVYDHIVAGGDSIAVLLTDVAARYAAARREDVPLPRYALAQRTSRSLFLRHPLALLRGLAALPGLVRGWRSVVRPRFRDVGDGRNGFVHFAVDAGRYARLRTRARALGVTTNDLLLAAVLAAAAAHAGPRDPGRRRHAVAIASIVNLRDDFGAPVHTVFGQFLSSFRVVHALPAGTTIDALARDLGAQTRAARQRRLHYLTLVAMGLAGALWRFASPSRRRHVYLKYHPVLGGITPLNVDVLRRQGTAAPGDYLRGAATGPMSPMVVGLTTSGGALRVGITYRSTALDDDAMRAIVEHLQQTIDTLTPPPSP